MNKTLKQLFVEKGIKKKKIAEKIDITDYQLSVLIKFENKINEAKKLLKEVK